DAGAHFGDRLIDQAERALATAALVRRCGREFTARGLQQGDALVHMRLRADGVADAHAGGYRRAERELAEARSRHVVLSWVCFLGCFQTMGKLYLPGGRPK